MEEIWKKHSADIYKLCEIRCNSSDDAKDLYQTVALKFYQNIREEMSPKEVFPWLLTILRNSHCDLYRRNKRIVCASSLHELGVDYEAIPESANRYFVDPWLEKDRSSDVNRLLSVLKPSERKLIELTILGGIPMANLTNFFGLSRFTLCKRKTSALEKMRKKLMEVERR